MAPLQIPLLVMGVACFVRVSSIMVPTGKLGPITPPKPSPSPLNPIPAVYRAPAPVWEGIDETGSGYKPPIYKYILWDYVQKYGHHTLIAMDEDYYKPLQVKTVNPYYYKNEIPSEKGAQSYYKNKFYYSPLQLL